MTPKDKAKDIVGRMCGNNCTETNINRMVKPALIAVDEIIESESNMFSEHYINAAKEDYFKKSHRYAYWLLVKQEIQNL